MCWNFKAWHSQRNVQLNCKHSDGAIKPRVHTNTVWEDHFHGLHSNKPSPFIANGSPYEFPCDWAGGRWGNSLDMCEKCNFLGGLDTMEFDPSLQFHVPDSSIRSTLDWEGREREKVAVRTCQLPFTFTEECWQALTMLSASVPDKSLQFINEIDGIAYRQLLHSVFSHASSQRHQCCLISSLPSPGLLRCFNIFLTVLLNSSVVEMCTFANTDRLTHMELGIKSRTHQCTSI